MQDSTFKVLHALCKPGEGSCPLQNAGSTGCISLESVNFPGYFLSATKGMDVKLLHSDGSSGFNAKASFCIQPGLADAAAVSLEIMGSKGKFIRHSGYGIFACTSTDKGDCVKSGRSAEFNEDATFFLKPGVFLGRCAGPKESTKCTCFQGFLGDDCKEGTVAVTQKRPNIFRSNFCSPCITACPGRERTGTTVTVCGGNGDCEEDKNQKAVCKCRSGFLGQKCQLSCPRDHDDNLCSGRGQCAVDSKYQPVCNCSPGIMGNVCQYTCPGKTAAHPACSGHGSCFVKAASGKEKPRAECSCSKGFKGFGCELECPKDTNGAICSAHGSCVLKKEKAVCACALGWRGNMCDQACPKDERGEICGGKGTCVTDKESGASSCKCDSGYGGTACTVGCPGMNKSGMACSGNGSCKLSGDKATCSCKNTHLGKACHLACPIDTHSSLPCGGLDRGECVIDPTMSTPTKCQCKEPFVGKFCQVKCPTFRNKICGGQGECFIKTVGKAQLGVCKCQGGFVGATCAEKCPADASGNLCSGHGSCSLSSSNRAQCTCEDSWVGKACSDKVCATGGGIFNQKTKQCTCAVGEVCCSQKTMQMLSKYEALKTSTDMADRRESADAFIDFASSVSPLVV